MTECMLNNLEEFVMKFKEQSTFDKKTHFRDCLEKFVEIIFSHG